MASFDALDRYIYEVGYMQQQWADVQLTFFDQAIKLHRSESRAAWHGALLDPQPGASHLLQSSSLVVPTWRR